MARKVTKQEFAQVKRWLMVFRGLGGEKRVARKAQRSHKTIIQIKHSKSYKDYVEQNKAQHPEVGYSLAEQIHTLHRMKFYKQGVPYIRKSARREIEELINKEK